MNPITNDEWLNKLEGKDISQYKLKEIWKGTENTSYAKYTPSQYFKEGDYPFSNLEDNQLVVKFVDDFIFFTTSDSRMVW